MIFSVFQKNWFLGYSWSTLLWYRCYYQHRSRDALSPVCGIFYGMIEAGDLSYLLEPNSFESQIVVLFALLYVFFILFFFYLALWLSHLSFQLDSLISSIKGRLASIMSGYCYSINNVVLNILCILHTREVFFDSITILSRTQFGLVFEMKMISLIFR